MSGDGEISAGRMIAGTECKEEKEMKNQLRAEELIKVAGEWEHKCEELM